MTKAQRASRRISADTTIYTEGVDPMVVQIRREQVRQKLSNYALGRDTGIGPDRLGKLWRGEMVPSFRVIRTLINQLRKGNPKFKVTDQ